MARFWMSAASSATGTAAGGCASALDVADEDLSRIEQSLELYVQHLLRKALSSTITVELLEQLKILLKN